MKVLVALATLLAAVSAQTAEDMEWCEDTPNYVNRDGTVVDTFDGIVENVEECKTLCDTDENGCNFVWFHPADRGLESECKLFMDVYKWKPRSFLDRGYTYNGRLCFPGDLKIHCMVDEDCFAAAHMCDSEHNACVERPTEEPTEATEEPTEATEEPTEATEEPTEATEEPTEATEEPTEATEEPSEATEEPTEATEEPSEATEEPTEATEEPSEATEEPTEATEEPTEATAEPSEATVEPSEATAEPTEATGEPTETVSSAPTVAEWCAPSINYPNHRGSPVGGPVKGLANVEECMAGCDATEGCNFVWFTAEEGLETRCRYWEGAEKRKAKAPKDIRTHTTYAGRVCAYEGELPYCEKDAHCYYKEHCNMEDNRCEPGAPEGMNLMTMFGSSVDEFGLFHLLFAAVGVAAVFHGSYKASKRMIFGSGTYTPVPAPIEEEV